MAAMGIAAPRLQAEKLKPVTGDPYVGAIAIDAATGKVLEESNADGPGYPASVVKLMDLLILLEKIQQGSLHLTDAVTVTAEASRTGGSQVYLAEKEVFTVDDLNYAMAVQSANDAAVALATHVAGTKEAFVGLMNRRAGELGMKSTQYHSVHGLPPGAGQAPDVSTPRDLAILARELLKYPDTLRYTSTRERPFRNGKFILRAHNHLLGSFEGCDGLKTGWFPAAGYSIVATAQRDGRRVIAVVMGSQSRTTRDAAARELLSRGLAALPPVPPPVIVTNAVSTNLPAKVVPSEAVKKPPRLTLATGATIALAVFVVMAAVFFARRSRQSHTSR